MLYIILYFFKPLLWLMFRPKVYGNKKALGTKGKAIFICNHVSMEDPLMLAIISPRIIHFMAKKEVFDTKLGKLFFSSMFVFPVDRGTADLKSLRNALNLLEKGKAFGIFPEGRRMVAYRMDEFELGTAFIAMRSNAPVIPMYLHNDSYKKWYTRPKIIVGDPIYASETKLNFSRRENEVIFMQRLRNTLESLKKELEKKCK
ncbi:MAG: 1-acyl-sn-glycerol-3-phosphate acyltransferase [Clostridiales bacterium]|nr:1-acyl-sn-glycerol-3-phosphate acyltransferase [Clostridiales bacterium]